MEDAWGEDSPEEDAVEDGCEGEETIEQDVVEEGEAPTETLEAHTVEDDGAETTETEEKDTLLAEFTKINSYTVPGGIIFFNL